MTRPLRCGGGGLLNAVPISLLLYLPTLSCMAVIGHWMLSTALFYEGDAGIALRGATTYTNNSEKRAALIFTERMSSNVAHGAGLIPA